MPFSLVFSLMGGFFTGGWSIIGRIVSGLLGSRAGLALIGAAALFVCGYYLGYSHERAIKDAAVAAAVAQQNAEWTQKLDQANAQVEFRVQAAIEAAKATPSAPDDRSDLDKLCADDPTASCRDNAGKGQRVQDAPRNMVKRRQPRDNKPHPKAGGGIFDAL